MLTRRQLLATIAAAPLAKFCKTEPARPWQPSLPKRPPGGFIDIGPAKPAWRLKYRDAREVERSYNPPQGTLG